jgi:hypothetical protein
VTSKTQQYLGLASDSADLARSSRSLKDMRLHLRTKASYMALADNEARLAGAVIPQDSTPEDGTLAAALKSPRPFHV